MNSVLRRSLTAAAFVMVSPVLARAGATVENYSGSGTVSIQYPGTAAPGGTKFQASAVLTSVSFTVGKQVLGANEIELHGLESAADHIMVEGKFVVPSLSGQTGTTITGEAGVINLAAGTKLAAGNLVLSGVPVKSVSTSQLVLGTTTTPVAAAMTNLAGNGGCVAAQLEFMAASGIGTRNYSTFVSDFRTDSSVSITSVDAVNGLVDFSGLGGISQVERSAGSASFETLAPMAGLGLLLFGLGGLGLARLMPRPQLALAS